MDNMNSFSYVMTDENDIIRYTMNQRRANLDYKRELIKSRSKKEFNKSQINQKKSLYTLKNYITDINKINYSKIPNKSYLTQNEIGQIKNSKYNYNYDYLEHEKKCVHQNKSFICRNGYLMNLTSPRNIKKYKQNIIEKVNKNKNNNTQRVFKTNHSINSINNDINKEIHKSTMNYNKLQENINIYLKENNRQIPNKSYRQSKNERNMNNIINKINFSKNKKINFIPIEKNNIHNCGNNTTTTNNTYNNNIYYISPIDYTNNKLKKKININPSISNTIYKNMDIIINKKNNNTTKQNNKIKDYFRMNIMNKTNKEIYTKAIVLIQSVFRAYLVKIKLYNNLNLYISCKKSIEILQKFFYQKGKKLFFNKLKNFFSYKILHNLLNTFHKRNVNINLYHTELGDSFNIKADKSNQKKLENKLNELIKENKELKNKILNNKTIEEKIHALSEENKKMQSINNIILKDNRQLAKRLKDFQEYRKNKLVIQKDIEKMQIHENNEDLFNKKKLAKIILNKLITKKNYENKNVLKINWDKYKDIIKNMKNKEILYKELKKIYLKNVLNIIEREIKSVKEISFTQLYYKSKIMQNNKNLIKEKLKNIIITKEKKRINILYHSLFNIMKANTIKNNNTNETDIPKLREIKLKKILNKYLFDVRLIYRIFMEKWNLKSKLIGIRTAARDKKRKRKQKKKINKLLYNKHYLVVDNFKHRDYSNKILSKSIQRFNYIVSDNDIIKDPNMEEGKLIIGNLSTNNIKYIYKKNNSTNKARRHSENINIEKNEDNINNENNNEEINSDEDSGDSFGFGNNSDNN